jgi:thiol reductant ABC exporter CydC subunit
MRPSGVVGHCRDAAGLRAAQFGPAAGAGALSAACGVGLLATSGWLITRASERPPVLSLCVAIGAVQAFSLGRGAFRYLQRIGAHRLSLTVLGRLRLHLYDTVVPLVPGGLGPSGPGAVLSGFVADTELVAEGFAKTTTAAVDVTASIALGVVVAGLVQPTLGVVVLAAAAAVVAVSVLLARLGRGLEVRTAAERAELAASVVQTVRSARELVAFGRQDLVDQRLEEVRGRSASLASRRALGSGAARAGAVLTAGGALMAVVGTGLAASGGRRLSGVMLAVVAFAALAVLDQCANLPAVLASGNSARAAAGRLDRLDRTPAPVAEPGVDLSATAVPGCGQLVDAVTTGAGGQAVLQGVSLEVGTGQYVALVGPSGSGKTAAVYALLHFVACSEGEARLGGVDVSDMTREGIATLAGWVPDETHIFAASLADNLRLGRPSATEAQCLAALERVGLARWANALPGGLSTVLGEGGRAVSAGERQRLGLARVLLADLSLLLLDEPTAHLDPAISAQVLAELMDAASGRAVLVVSHDAEIADHVDEVVTLGAGRVSDVSRGGRTTR